MGIQERKEREKERRRKEIIDAAEKIFFSKGVNNATMDEVAKAAELSKGTLYLYFSSKEELHWAITKRGFIILDEYLKTAVSDENSGFQNLVALGEAYIKYSEDHYNYFDSMLMFDVTDMDSLPETVKVIKENFFTDSPMVYIISCIKDGIKEGQIRQDIPVNILAINLWAQLMGILQITARKSKIFKKCNIDRDELLSAFFKLVRNGMINKN